MKIAAACVLAALICATLLTLAGCAPARLAAHCLASPQNCN